MCVKLLLHNYYNDLKIELNSLISSENNLKTLYICRITSYSIIVPLLRTYMVKNLTKTGKK